MSPGKSASVGSKVNNAPSGGEPELWTSFQKRGTVELLMLLTSDEELRMRDVVLAFPGIAKQTLVNRLNELGSLGIVNRRVENGPPVSTWYSLTALGTELAGAAEILTRVGDKVSRRE